MAAKINVRRITLQAYEKQTVDIMSAPLFVLNTTKQPQGEIIFNVTGESGHRVAAVVPATFIPIDLTQEIHRTNLLQCSEFKKLIQRGRLAVLDPESAAAYMRSSARARDEYHHLYGTDYIVEEDMDMESFEGNTDETVELSEDYVQADNEVTFPVAEEILALCKTDEDRAHSLLNSRGLDMDIEELQYISNTSTSTRLKELAVDVIGEIEADSEEE